MFTHILARPLLDPPRASALHPPPATLVSRSPSAISGVISLWPPPYHLPPPVFPPYLYFGLGLLPFRLQGLDFLLKLHIPPPRLLQHAAALPRPTRGRD